MLEIREMKDKTVNDKKIQNLKFDKWSARAKQLVK